MAVFWVVVPCTLENFTDVSEVLVASIIKEIQASIIALMMEAATPLKRR
jgi:hypothetical protein